MDGGIDYFDDYLVRQMNEYFPQYTFVRNVGRFSNGSLGFCNGKYWGSVSYQGLPPEQQLDILRKTVENYFDGDGNIKSQNG